MERLKITIVIIVLLVALALGLASFVTHHWIQYELENNRTFPEFVTNSKISYLYHSRTRGLFYEVLKINSETQQVIDSNAMSPMFVRAYGTGIACNDGSTGFASLRALSVSSVSLLIFYLGLIGLAAWFSAIALIHGACKKLFCFSTVILVFGELAGIIGMVMFHVHLEAEKATDAPELKNVLFYYWSAYLKSVTKEQFSYSFAVQWASLGFGLLAACLSIVFLLRRDKKGKETEDKTEMQATETNPYGGPLDYGNMEPPPEYGVDNRRHSWSGYWEDGDERYRREPSPRANPPTTYPRVLPTNDNSRWLWREDNAPRRNPNPTRQHYHSRTDPTFPALY